MNHAEVLGGTSRASSFPHLRRAHPPTPPPAPPPLRGRTTGHANESTAGLGEAGFERM